MGKGRWKKKKRRSDHNTKEGDRGGQDGSSRPTGGAGGAVVAARGPAPAPRSTARAAQPLAPNRAAALPAGWSLGRSLPGAARCSGGFRGDGWGRCRDCSQAAALHVLRVRADAAPNHRGKGGRGAAGPPAAATLGTVVVSVRNARCAAVAHLGMGLSAAAGAATDLLAPALAAVRSAAAGARSKKHGSSGTTPAEWQVLVGDLDDAARRARAQWSDDPEAALALVGALDAAYHRAYYLACIELGRPAAGRAVVAPDVYFAGGCAWDVDAAGEAVAALLARYPLLARAEEAQWPPGEGNPLLAVLRARWRETVWLVGPSTPLGAAYCSNAGLLEPASTHPRQTITNKRNDPVAPPVLAKWRDACRDWAAHLMAYATPNEAALRALEGVAPLLEVGAGTGYWASLLRARGVDVRAVDVAPVPVDSVVAGKANAYHGRVPAFSRVERGGVDAAATGDASRRTLFLCYPPPKSPMAARALAAYAGSTVAYVGEWQGDTADTAFEAALHGGFSHVRTVPLPQWGNTSYALTIWRRKRRGGGGDGDSDGDSDGGAEAGGAAPAIVCDACGGAGADRGRALRRCRVTCDATYCSPECAARCVERHTARLALKGVYVDAAALNLRERDHYRVLSLPWARTAGGSVGGGAGAAQTHKRARAPSTSSGKRARQGE